MNATAESLQDIPAITAADLTHTQRHLLKAAAFGGKLVRTPRGYQGMDTGGHLLMPPFPVRSVNAMQRSDLLERADTRGGMKLTAAGRAIVGGLA